MIAPQYVYRARIVRVIDGDTCVLAIDLGCFVSIVRGVRLLGLNTPEIVGPDKARGLAAAQAARDWCAATALANPDTAWPLVAETTLDKADKFGRLLGVIHAKGDPVSLNQFLLANGWAKAYAGEKRS